MLDSTRAVGDFAFDNAMRVKRIVVEVLKAIAKCWAFFKDIHFSVYVIIPVISSFTSLDQTATLLLWALFFLPILAVITFTALDSIFAFGVPDGKQNAASRTASHLSAFTAKPGREATFGPMQSRRLATPARRHRALRPVRSRRPGYW